MTTIQEALREHLTHNLVPSMPDSYIEPCIEALKWVKQGEFGVLVYIPMEVKPRPNKAKEHDGKLYIFSSDLVDALRLDSPVFYNLIED